VAKSVTIPTIKVTPYSIGYGAMFDVITETNVTVATMLTQHGTLVEPTDDAVVHTIDEVDGINMTTPEESGYAIGLGPRSWPMVHYAFIILYGNSTSTPISDSSVPASSSSLGESERLPRYNDSLMATSSYVSARAIIDFIYWTQTDANGIGAARAIGITPAGQVPLLWPAILQSLMTATVDDVPLSPRSACYSGYPAMDLCSGHGTCTVGGGADGLGQCFCEADWEGTHCETASSTANMRTDNNSNLAVALSVGLSVGGLALLALLAAVLAVVLAVRFRARRLGDLVRRA
jgi:hypothetical protein